MSWRFGRAELGDRQPNRFYRFASRTTDLCSSDIQSYRVEGDVAADVEGFAVFVAEGAVGGALFGDEDLADQFAFGVKQWMPSCALVQMFPCTSQRKPSAMPGLTTAKMRKLLRDLPSELTSKAATLRGSPLSAT